nr:hypothetical protein RF1 [Trentepohlia sp. YN1242]
MFLSIIKDFNATYHSILTTQELQNHDFLQISWKICIFFFTKLWSTLIYLFTFQWLRDFAYFPISLPELSEKMTVLPPMGQNSPETSSLVSRAGENLFDWFLGTPSSSWSLAFLSPTWFDHLTTSNQFISETDGFNLSQFLSILIIIGLSSFFNSFLINFPLSITNIWCLRYSISHNFKTSCIAILGVIIGEITFMLFLVLPPPFIQITLTYLESIWPYIFGIILVIWAIFDSVNNASSIHFFSPYRQNTPERSSLREKGPKSESINFWPILRFTFLLSFTEQACCFSYFGSLNLTSSSNFLDTYIFAASASPIFLIVSCLGFSIGSFFTLILFNYFCTQILYLAIMLGQWPINFFRLLFESSRQENKAERLKEMVILFFKNGRQKIQTSVGTIFHSESFKNASYGPSSKFQTNSSKPVTGITSWIFFNLKLIFNFILYPLKKILPFFLFLFSSKSSVQIESLPKNNVSPSANRDVFYKSKEIIPFQMYFSSFFNRINHWYETSSPFSSSRSLSSGINANSISILNEQNISPPISKIEGIPRTSQKRKQISLQTILKIDKFLLTCLITFVFTTIPYYSCDYLVNQFLGITPRDELLNNHNLRVNYTDYSSLLGIQLPDKSSIFNTDVSLFDRAHFMYGEWPNSFESLNYQGELFWTNLRDHRRQKRTRRSTRIKFKNLKSKIATSWKAFKRSDSLSLEKKIDNFSEQQEGNIDENTFDDFEKNQKLNTFDSNNLQTVKTDQLFINNRLKNDKNIFSKLFNKNLDLSLNSQDIQNRRESISETMKNLSSASFKDLSSNAKSFTNYSKNWKKVITEKYYQNQIYKILLSNDLKNFIKREPASQQLTTAQEKELEFLRIKMCHYFDTLRFYFKMKEKIKPYSNMVQNPLDNSTSEVQKMNRLNNSLNDTNYSSSSISSFADETNIKKNEKSSSLNTEPLTKYDEINQSSKSSLINNPQSQIRLNNLPFQFKSMSSLNYHQRFKGTLKPVSELFQISLPNSISFDKSLFNEFSINQNSFFHEESLKNVSSKTNSKETSQIYNLFGSNNPFYVGWDKNLRKFILTSRFLPRPSSLAEQVSTNQTKTVPRDQSLKQDLKNDKKIRSNQFNLYRTYSSWPFFKSQLTNPIERPYSVMYENYFNILNKNLKIFPNININNIDKKSLSFLFTYSLTDPKNKKLVSQLPQNIYKLSMQPTSSQDIFGPFQNTWSWPGSSIFSREYFFK